HLLRRRHWRCHVAKASQRQALGLANLCRWQDLFSLRGWRINGHQARRQVRNRRSELDRRALPGIDRSQSRQSFYSLAAQPVLYRQVAAMDLVALIVATQEFFGIELPDD